RGAARRGQGPGEPAGADTGGPEGQVHAGRGVRRDAGGVRGVPRGLMEPAEGPTQELVVMYLSRAVEQLEAIQNRLEAGETVAEAERLDALTGSVHGLTACLAILAQKVDELGA